MSAAAETVPTSPAGIFSRDFSLRDKLVLLGILTVIYAVAGTWGQFNFGDNMRYYTLGADAAAKGQLYIDYTPEQINLIDLVPYQGKYYLQWGPLPIAFHLAARLVGWNLSDRVACLLAGLLSCWVFLEIVLELRRRYFPGLSRHFCIWFLFAYALATPAALVAWRGTVYNESIGIAALGVLAAFWAFLRYQRRPVARWLLLAGVCMGGALLTRLTAVFYAVPFVLAVAATSWARRRQARAVFLQLATLSVPLVVGGLLQMVYNHARFGSPFEFGLKYKPESLTRDLRTFSPERIPENLGHYVFSLPKMTSDFPWLDHTGWEPRVHTTFAEGMSSIFLASPFLLLGLLLGRILHSKSGYPLELKIASALAAGSGLLAFVAMLCFVSASRRYAQDFVPMLTVAAFLGAATLSVKTLRRWAAPAWMVVALSAPLHAHVAFYESFRSPTPDLNVTRAFIAMAPAIRQISPGPELDKEEAMARNDWATVLLNQRRLPEALDQFRRARELMPDSPAIARNVELAERLAAQPPAGRAP